MVYCTGVNTGTAFYALNYAANATNLVSGGTIASNVTATTQAAGTNNTTVATTAFATTAIQAIYPVGSIYTSTVSTNPNTLFGFGTWVAFGAGRVMIGNGGGYSAGATGGSADATLVSHSHTFSGTTASGNAAISDPGHSHTITYVPNLAGGGSGGPDLNGSSTSKSTTTSTTGITDSGHTHGFSGTTATEGSSATNANLQPYIVVYMWNRTA